MAPGLVSAWSAQLARLSLLVGIVGLRLDAVAAQIIKHFPIPPLHHPWLHLIDLSLDTEGLRGELWKDCAALLGLLGLLVHGWVDVAVGCVVFQLLAFSWRVGYGRADVACGASGADGAERVGGTRTALRGHRLLADQ